MLKIAEKDAEQLAKEYYGVKASVKKLHGEIDLNFYLQDSAGKAYILKIANPQESLAQLELQNSIMKRLRSASAGLKTQNLVPAHDGAEIVTLSIDGSTRFMRLLTWIDGRVLATVNPHSPTLLYRLGEMCGKVSRGLSGFDHEAARRFIKWDPSSAAWINDHAEKFKGEKREVFDYFYALFEKAMPALSSTRYGINHNDINDYNVLVSGIGNTVSVEGVIDFGDAVYTNTINELAIALAYAMMHKNNPLEAALPVVKGYHDQFPIEEQALAVLFPMITARLLISVTCSALNLEEHPENIYLQVSDGPAWDLLNKLRAIPSDLMHYAFRNACGLIPCPNNQKFTSWVLANHNEATFPVEGAENARFLDLSVGSLDAGTMNNLLDPNLFDRKVSQLMADTGDSVAIGRYDEPRAFYSTDAFAFPGNDAQAWRTVHIGMDFFASPKTAVVAVLDGTLYSAKNNDADRDYGPTLILEHKISNDFIFYTLYGHLTTDSLLSFTVGQSFKKGEVIGRIGNRSENGNWPPHLHFQIVLDMLGKVGDFPGVASANERGLWKSISPDPWLLLTGKRSAQQPSLSKEEIVDYRKKHLGKNMSISYRDPIKMVRGHGAYMLDDTGRRYLDTVNNVAHVGHEHPRVVCAGQRQMAVLNTNTRYLHENIVKFVEAILETMPSGLNVAYIVNSGSEANELALRLAKNYTGQKDMIVSEVGYHGNTNACIEISSYKFDGVGGKGVSPSVHVVPIPDVYRGRYRDDDPKASSRYASHVQGAVTSIHQLGRKPAALIFESVISCGGQVELPKDFLKEAYQHVRKAGGVCIADEVQTGCGRAGDFFWAFMEHGVVPDIVTIGKPIGNGHPLGVVVTTQSVADAFVNGMEYFNTFGGNPVSCAIGLEVLSVIKDEGLQHNAKIIGDYLKSGLRNLMKEYEVIGDVRGPGLFIGFEFVKNRETKGPATEEASYFANRMRDKGILMSTDGPYNNVIKVKPPIVFTHSQADYLLEATELVLKEDFMMPGK
ncbi:MAG: aminotransferase class III-fold pyridoxal phosphate-dependent enzyme [Cyclobacteriaceae bacterium]|nr:aminotransferase class III-fold pyridoxal phosphate-dependent enzyme [Cyclobacteriaceae bacterium]MDH4296112.1 aminotransferase class III-fold pyridoxal phosphate-dependent enzyme [Cyclobacteriaceae bacterium]